MKIEKEKLSLALSEIEKYSPKCPICGSHDLNYLDDEAQIMMFERNGTSIELEKAVSFKPTLTLNCEKCGYVLLFDLIHLLSKKDAL